MIEFAVSNTTAGAHALDIARRDGLDIAHAVLVGQLAGKHIGDNLHVAMGVLAEAGARLDVVFVDDAQIAPAHAGRIVVVGKGKRMFADQPAMVGVAAFGGFDQVQHVGPPCCDDG